jgi:PIN domain nuclease of toxin-antitoxin system
VERDEVTYLDTHVVVWLYRRDLELLSRNARDQIERDDLLISPAVLLELEYLSEIQAQRPRALTVTRALEKDVGLKVCDFPFADVVEQALGEKWGRDPFDRLIVAQAKANDLPLISKDRKIRQHYRQSVW